MAVSFENLGWSLVFGISMTDMCAFDKNDEKIEVNLLEVGFYLGFIKIGIIF